MDVTYLIAFILILLMVIWYIVDDRFSGTSTKQPEVLPDSWKEGDIPRYESGVQMREHLESLGVHISGRRPIQNATFELIIEAFERIHKMEAELNNLKETK